MANYEYILTVHWAHFGPREYPFYDFHAAFESAKSLLKATSVSYVTLKRKPVHKPSIQEAYQAWEILHREGRI